MATDLRFVISVASLVLVALHVPFLMGRVPPNRLYGFRTRKTLRPDVWYPANAFAAKAMIVALAIGLFALWSLPPERMPSWFPIAAFMLPLGGAVLAAFVHLRRYP